jgi:3-dehydroquinate dehydratase
MEFTTAYIVGVDRNSEYFGERTAQYRTVDSISVEGYIDSRSANEDFKGVRQTLSSIQDNFVDPLNNANVCEEIIINGSGFGTGRVVSIEFPASNSVDENQVTIGKYNAQIEIYNSGQLGTSLEGATVPNLEYLQNLTEDFSISLDQDNVYTLSHSVDITYLSGVNVNPISNAKTLASTLLAQTPSQFSTLIPNSYGSISAASRKYYTENYNLIDGSSTFEQSIKLLPSGFSNYSLQVDNSFSFDDAGIVKVSEDGTIEPRSPEFLKEAKDALDTELAKSYDRCNAIYTAYKNYLGANSSTLFNLPVSKSKNINNSAGTSTYSVEFTDDLKVKNLTSLEERSLSLELADNVYTVTENGTVTSINSKNTSFDPYALIPNRSTVKTRCTNYYNQEKSSSNQYTLKNLNNKFTIPAYGKQITYTYAFTSDGEVSDAGTFARKSIKHSDKIGVPNQSVMTVPNFTSQVLHEPNQTSLGTRNTTIEGQMRRSKFTNNLTEIQNYRAAGANTVINAINEAKVDALQDAYMVYADNNLIRSLDKNQIYVTSCNFSYGSDNTFNMSVDSTYSMERNANNEYNLSFSP